MRKKVLLRTPAKCPYCGDKRSKKHPEPYTVRQPSGAFSALYRVECVGCRQNYKMREIFKMQGGGDDVPGS